MREDGAKARMRSMVVSLESDSSYSNLLRPSRVMPCLKGHQVAIPLRVLQPSGKLYGVHSLASGANGHPSLS
jgi:hypothetical protein